MIGSSVLMRATGLLGGYGRLSYAQEGEDLVLERLLAGRLRGFYVDIGAHHPRRFSNTYLFYQRGWSGINIDATPGSMKRFKQVRSRDINLEAAVADTQHEIVFYMFNEPACNTFDEALARSYSAGACQLTETKRLTTRRLEDILRDHLPPSVRIDFMSVDVEGFDLQVLRSNDWAAFRPDVVLVEALELNIPSLFDGMVYQFMVANGYTLTAKTANTLFFATA